MHVLQSKNSKLKKEDVDKLLTEFNISLTQLPKISKKDPLIEGNFEVGEVVKFERKSEEGVEEYFRVVV